MKNDKIWRVNVAALYRDEWCKPYVRSLLDAIMSNLATFYKIEYKTIYDHLMHVEDDLSPRKVRDNIADEFYFRSNPDTELSAKEFRDLLDGIFCKSCVWDYYHVDIFSQNRTFLRLFPFPD